MAILDAPRQDRFDVEAGFAVGPILFLIALLAILAAAIAAGSGILSARTSNESDKTKAAALLEIGENLKQGMDRLVLENEVPFASLDTSIANTSGKNALFSPTGGGITSPSYSLANNPSTDGTAATGDIWYFPQGAVPGVGSGANDLLAVLSVTQGTCNEINNQVNAAVPPPVNDFGDFTSNALTAASWPPALNAVTVGCIQNNNAASTGYFFFKVLAIE